jgi:hypothetical protein
MNTTSLMLGLLFGAIGMGYVMFGKKQGQLVPIGAGVGLMVVPMFLTSVLLCSVVCVAMMALPWLMKDA